MRNKLDQVMVDAGKLLDAADTMYPDLFDSDVVSNLWPENGGLL